MEKVFNQLVDANLIQERAGLYRLTDVIKFGFVKSDKTGTYTRVPFVGCPSWGKNKLFPVGLGDDMVGDRRVNDSGHGWRFAGW